MKIILALRVPLVLVLLAPSAAVAQADEPIAGAEVLAMDLEPLSAEDLEVLGARLAVEESLRWSELPHPSLLPPALTILFGGLAFIGGVLTGLIGFQSDAAVATAVVVGPLGGVTVIAGGIWAGVWRAENLGSDRFSPVRTARRAMDLVALEQRLRARR